MKQFSLLMTLLLISAATLAQWPAWEPTNGPYGGRVTKLKIDRHGHLFAGTENKGLYRSSNSGQNWVQSGLVSENINAVEFDSTGTMLASTYNGLFLSPDDGATWHATSIGKMPVGGITVHPSGTIFVTSDRNLLKSTNQGQTWQNSGLGSVRSMLFSKEYGLLAVYGGNIYFSADTGRSWNRRDTTMNNVLSIFQVSRRLLFATVQSKGLFRSANGGATWDSIGLDSRGGYSVSSLGATSPGVLVAGVIPIDPSIPGGVYMSPDTGRTWTGPALKEWRIFAVAVSPSDEVYLGTDRGVFRSTSSGVSWGMRNEGLTAAQVRGLVAFGTSTVLAGTNVGIFRSTNQGNTWEDVSAAIYPRQVSCVAADKDGRTFLGGGVFWPDGGVYRSTDEGSTWTQVSKDYIKGMYKVVNSIAISESGHVFAALSYEIFRSTDHGTTWVRWAVNGMIRMLAVDTQGRIFGATWGNGVLRSTDNGASWGNTANGLPNPNLYCVVIKDSGNVFVGGIGGVSRSTDHGDTWRGLYGAAIIGSPIEAMIVDRNGDLLASTSDKRVFRSTNNGETWIKETQGLPNNLVSAFAASPEGTIYAGTDSSGVYRTAAVSAVPSEPEALPANFALKQNYPNPFNPKTVVSYQLPVASKVWLVVYDLLGREIATLVDEDKPAGVHQVECDASGLASGVYLYRMSVAPLAPRDLVPTNGRDGTAGSYTSTRKMIVVK